MATKPSDPVIVEVSLGADNQLTAKITENQDNNIKAIAAAMAGTPGAPAPAPAAIGDNNGAAPTTGGSSKGGKSRRNRKSRGGKSRKARKSLRRK